MTDQGVLQSSLPRLFWALAASVAIYAMAALVFPIHWAALAQAWDTANKSLLAATLLFSIAFHVLVGADKLWRVLQTMRPLGFDLPYVTVLRLRLGAGPLRLFVPVDAGELVNILFFWRHEKVEPGQAAGAALFDRGLNLIGSGFWLVWGLALWGAGLDMTAVVWMAGLALCYVLFFFAVPVHSGVIGLASRIHPRLGKLARGVLEPFAACPARKKLFFCLYGVVFQARPLVVCWLLFAAFGVTPDPGSFIALASVAVFAGHLPSASGMGPREAALVALFSGQAPASTLFAVGFLLGLFVHILPMAVGLPWTPWLLERIKNGKKSA